VARPGDQPAGRATAPSQLRVTGYASTRHPVDNGWVDNGWVDNGCGWVDNGWVDNGWVDKGWVDKVGLSAMGPTI